MARWKPDARGRLRDAALALYIERGFEQTTVSDIAERAGVTERTFFRHFADKREVLFDGSAVLQEALLSAIASFPASAAAMTTAGEAMASSCDEVLGSGRDYARLRAQTIAANPGLYERELLKLALLGAAATEALRARGVEPLPARLAAEAGITVFIAGFERWIADDSAPGLGVCIREALTELRIIAAAV